MLHPIFSTLVTRPDLIFDHISGYAALLGQETSALGSQVLKKIAAWVMVVLCLTVSLALAGTAVLLGSIHHEFHWALVAVPGVALLLTLLAWMQARKPLTDGSYSEFKSQIATDAEALRNAGAHRGR